jgi:RNA-splicing ligase RtcB
MILEGKYGKAKVYTELVEETAVEQIKELLNQPFAEDANIRIMPDVHAGAGCVIGTTMKIRDKVCPNLVGVDIGCGMMTVPLTVHEGEFDMKEFDGVVHYNIPAGFNVHSSPFDYPTQTATLLNLNCWRYVKNQDRILNSLGTLGGGNHFIEINKGAEGTLYLVIHTGSRNLGVQVATHYQNLAISRMKEKSQVDIKALAKQMKDEGRQSEIPLMIRNIKACSPTIPDQLAYLEGQDMENYLHDMRIAQHWAKMNRKKIATILLNKMNWDSPNLNFHTVHNYIDDDRTLRKGAISAKDGESILIPMNMRDGSLLCVGKGNDDWNQSAPHGAGRLMSRGQARRGLSVEEFKETMKDVYSTTVNAETLDEAPMAYKPMESIMDAIKDTATMIERLTPIYNFKASGD